MFKDREFWLSTFPETKALLTETPKIMSLLDPAKKMSKSLGDSHVISLMDNPNTIEKKVKKAVTDSGEGGSPGAKNLLLILKNFADKVIYEQFAEAEKQGSIRYGDLKKITADAVAMYFEDFREKREHYLIEQKELNKILAIGAEKARMVAEKTMKDVRRLVGVR